jgi:hypothetical protein
VRALLRVCKIVEITKWFIAEISTGASWNFDILPVGTEENRRFRRMCELLAADNIRIIEVLFEEARASEHHNRAAVLYLVGSHSAEISKHANLLTPDLDKFSARNLSLMLAYAIWTNNFEKCKHLVKMGAVSTPAVLVAINKHWNFAIFELVACPESVSLLAGAIRNKKLDFVRHICKFYKQNIKRCEFAHYFYEAVYDDGNYAAIQILVQHGIYNVENLVDEIEQTRFNDMRQAAHQMLVELHRRYVQLDGCEAR